jgi:hypothetical protein
MKSFRQKIAVHVSSLFSPSLQALLGSRVFLEQAAQAIKTYMRNIL